jgi:hypothetical protein
VHELQQYTVAENFFLRASQAYGCCSNSADADADAEADNATDASNSRKRSASESGADAKDMPPDGDTSKNRESPKRPRHADGEHGSTSRAVQQCLHKVCLALSSMMLAAEVAVAHSVQPQQQQQQQPGGDAAVADSDKHLLRVP